MVADAAHDPMLALLEKINPPWHRTIYSHWYIDLSSNTLRRCDGPPHKGCDLTIRYEQLKREIQILETKLEGKPRLPSPPPPSKPSQEYVSLDLVCPRELCGLPPLPPHMVPLNPTTSVNLGLVDAGLTSPAWPEASSGPPQLPGSTHSAFHGASRNLPAPQSIHLSLCAPNLKASSTVTSEVERTSTNSCNSSDMEDSTEGDLDDGDYVEPTKTKVGRRRKTSTSGVRVPCGSYPCQKLVTHNEKGEPLREPYQCTDTCRTKQNLHRHYNLTKHGGTRIKCPHCEDDFSRKDQLRPHLRTRCRKFTLLKGEGIIKKPATRGQHSKKPKKTKGQSLRKPVSSLV